MIRPTIHAQLEAALDHLKVIGALVENPHWTADRRWKIGERATQAKTLITQAQDTLIDMCLKVIDVAKELDCADGGLLDNVNLMDLEDDHGLRLRSAVLLARGMDRPQPAPEVKR